MNILFGGVSLNSSVGYPANSLGFICANDKDAHIIYDLRADDLNSILKKLPVDWKPDIILWWSPEYFNYPQGIEDSPYPTVAIVGDWNVGFSSLKENLKRFDFIVTDKQGVDIFKKLSYENIENWKMFSHETRNNKKLDNIEKIYDIAFIGSFNHDIHNKRSKYLYKLVKLSEKYNIKLFTNIFSQEYTKILNQAKIIFNMSVRKELNLRCHEAPACGSLLFIEDDNLEIKNILRDKIECVYYNEENFESLIEYYLNNDDERISITEAGYKTIQSQTYKDRLIELLELLKENNIHTKKISKRPFSDLPKDVQFYNYGFSALQGIETGKDIATDMFEKALKINPNSCEYLNACGFSYASRTNKIDDIKTKEIILKKAYRFISKAISINNNAVICYYNLGNIALELNQIKTAKDKFFKLIELLDSSEEIIFFDLFFPRIYDLFRMEWEKLSINNINQDENLKHERKKLLIWKTGEILGDIFYKENDYKNSEFWYKKAIFAKLEISATTRRKLGNVFEKLEENSNAITEYTKAIEIEPFNMPSWEGLISVLYKTKQYDECLRQCKELLLIINCSPFYENARIFVNSIMNNISLNISE